MSRVYPELSNIRRQDGIEKFHYRSGIVPQKTCLMGYEINTRQIWVFVSLLFLSLLSLTGTFTMWFTPSFDNLILNSMVLRNNSDALKLFRKPLTPSLVKVHIFNYTNFKDFVDGYDEKLKVKEVGPYVYENELERVNVEFHDNGTLSYQEKHKFEFRADLSKLRRQSDRLIVPNLPMLGTAAAGKNTLLVGQWAMSGIFRSMNAKPFTEVPAHRFIWGYDDDLYSLARGFSAFQKPLPLEKFGLLARHNGTSPDVKTIYDGENGMEKFAYISEYGGEEEIPHWSAEECKKIEGSDATLFPPYTIRQKKTVYVYVKDICRRLPFKFEKEVKLFNDTIRAFRYKIPTNVFDEPNKLPENQCFCHLDSGVCPPQGLFNATPCSFDAPFFLSFPHFYMASPEVRDAVEGLKPVPHLHESYINVHPRLGYSMSGFARLQINIQIKKSLGISQLKRFEDDMILPVAWVEFGLDEKDLNQASLDLIHKTTYLVQGLEMAFKYGFLLTHVITVICIIIVLKGKLCNKKLPHFRPVQRRLLE